MTLFQPISIFYTTVANFSNQITNLSKFPNFTPICFQRNLPQFNTGCSTKSKCKLETDFLDLNCSTNGVRLPEIQIKYHGTRNGKIKVRLGSHLKISLIKYPGILKGKKEINNLHSAYAVPRICIPNLD